MRFHPAPMLSTAAVLVLIAGDALAQTRPNGQALFTQRCASCHAGTDPRVPTVEALRQRTATAIVDALTTGAMREQGASLSDAERRAIAAFLGMVGGTTAVTSTTARCTASDAGSSTTTGARWTASGAQWAGWSPDLGNTRFQPADQAGLAADAVPRLTLKWAFGFPNATAARSLPTVAGGRVFVGSQSGTIYSLDARTGCVLWTFKAEADVRSAIVLGPKSGGGTAAYFGDGRANVYALDAASGQMLWTRKVEDHRAARVSGSPALYQGRLYIGVASLEEGRGNDPSYECCTFRGSVVALDASSGAIAWKTYTIDEPKVVGKNASGTQRWGPSGAGVWASPTVDARRQVVYVATGNNYTEPASPTSDSVMALALGSGSVVWSAQFTPNDVFVVGCSPRPGVNCPGALGPDFDFGNSPMVVTAPGGRDLIVIGQKSGIGWAIDPDKRGAVVWQYRAGQGSALGGMEYGSAVDGEKAYFPVADGFSQQPGGLHAVTLATGARAWLAPPPAELMCGARSASCHPALLAAITVIPGVVFAGSNDGGIRGYSTKDGSVLWEFNTNRDFETVNGVPAKGATINGPGPVVAGGMLFVGSGAGSLGGRPGNVLLAFGVD